MAGFNHVDHVVVLMMENRSYDHILGARFELDTLVQRSNPQPSLSEPYLARIRGATEVEPPHWDPPHDHQSVMNQIAANSDHGPMSGFISTAYQAFRQRSPDITHHIALEWAQKTMHSLNPSINVVLPNLAEQHIFIDRWFSDVPGSTWPNRCFAQYATSHGMLGTPEGFDFEGLGLFSSYREALGRIRSIFSDLEEAGKTWRIYHHGTPFSALTMVQKYVKDSIFAQAYDSGISTWEPRSGFFPFSRYQLHVHQRQLAHYTFIEPAYSGEPNDQHPPADLTSGEELISQVAGTIIQVENSPEPQRIALLIVYDEHGGLFDRMLPPPAPSPDNITHPGGFEFDQYGCRVPAVLICPTIPQLEIQPSDRPFSHASICKTVRQLFMPHTDYLSQREEDAPSFLPGISSMEPSIFQGPFHRPSSFDHAKFLTSFNESSHASLDFLIQLIDRVSSMSELVKPLFDRFKSACFLNHAAAAGIETESQKIAFENALHILSDELDDVVDQVMKDLV